MFARHFLLVVFLCFAQARGYAQMPPKHGDATFDKALDCWISDAGGVIVSYQIRCVPGRDQQLVEPPAAPADGELLALIQQRIHRGEVLELDAELAAGRYASVARYLSHVRIHQYPYDESWRTGRPQMLVQSVLCGAARTCPVFIQR